MRAANGPRATRGARGRHDVYISRLLRHYALMTEIRIFYFTSEPAVSFYPIDLEGEILHTNQEPESAVAGRNFYGNGSFGSFRKKRAELAKCLNASSR
jgi:hypothetical protein